MCGVYKIEVCEPWPNSIRAQVCGKAYVKGRSRLEGREISNTKLMVISTMIQRRYIDKHCTDDNQADACAGFCWMEANHSRETPKDFALTSKV